jgi:hypothetical protein
MSNDDMPPEFMYCFNVMEEIHKDEAFKRRLRAETIRLLTFLLVRYF